MAAALAIREGGRSVAIVDREEALGGILMQCIHNGFGLHEFGEDLTGPEFAERLTASAVAAAGIDVYLRTTDRMDISGAGGRAGMADRRRVRLLARHRRARAAARSSWRWAAANATAATSRIPGTRPAGVFTAGLAQRLINIDGYLPGRRVVIDRLRRHRPDHGAPPDAGPGREVLGVVEILPYPSGLTRNIVAVPERLRHPAAPVARGEPRSAAATGWRRWR